MIIKLKISNALTLPTKNSNRLILVVTNIIKNKLS